MRKFIKVYCAVMFIMAVLLLVLAWQTLSEAMYSVEQMRALGQLEDIAAFDIFSFYFNNVMFNLVYALLLGAGGLILLRNNTPHKSPKAQDTEEEAEDFWSLPGANTGDETHGEVPDTDEDK
ncbi:MAG: hypothetical protein FWE20_01215 [Defluviitaleaceae bacterium]|nr:hypothetical protein [Defluviitaleaceae bacterium]